MPHIARPEIAKLRAADGRRLLPGNRARPARNTLPAALVLLLIDRVACPAQLPTLIRATAPW